MSAPSSTQAAVSSSGRPHAERLRFDLNEIRAELVQIVRDAAPGALNEAPRPGMKSVKQQLQEIGTMEELSRRWVTHQQMPDWNATWQTLDGERAEDVLSALERVRAETLAYLDSCSEQQLETPIPLPAEWYDYFGGATQIEPEELIRWVARHEYYHLGQLNAYALLRGEGSPPGAA